MVGGGVVRGGDLQKPQKWQKLWSHDLTLQDFVKPFCAHDPMKWIIN